jgi:ATP-dependent RNA helicase DeaD
VSLIRKIVGALSGAPSSPRTTILSDTEIEVPTSETDGGRRRGTRGGRGRGGGSSRNGASANGNGSAPAPERTERRGRPSRWQRPARETLDAPLPEDIAFRPAAEGGDASILPVRRRPPPNARRPGRVLYGGIKEYVSRDGSVVPPPSAAAPEVTLPPLTSDHADAVESADPAKRRRRGRRGGRGRRRTGEGTTNGDTDAGESQPSIDTELDDLDDTDAPEYATEDDFADEGEALDFDAPVAARAPLTTIPPDELPEAFRALGIGDRALEAVARLGFTMPTPIQERTIPALLAGRDVVGVAQTGTGKTLAFGIPMIECLDASRRGPQALVLVPTRELAQQVLEVLTYLGRSMGFEAVGLLGGHRLDRDFRALEQDPHIVVGTPGRIIDHLHRGTLSLAGIRYAVLDEADQMLDIGFLPDITRILSRTPRARQTALFSATMPHSILRLVRRYMEQPETVAIAPENTTVESVEQIYIEVAQRDKVRGLHELIERELKGRTLVFSRTRRGVDYVAGRLSDAGVRVGALHGDMEQRRRDQVVQRFRAGELDILIATNVAARGLDIPEITHVVNYDVPMNAEEYVHRIGRTGRAGREGKAITFVCEYDVAEFDVLVAAFGDRLQKEELRLYG